MENEGLPGGAGKLVENIVWKAEREKSLKGRCDQTNTRMRPLNLTFWKFAVSSLIIYMPKKYEKELLKLGDIE